MTEQAAKRQKLNEGMNSGDMERTVDNSYSLVVNQGMGTTEVRDFHVPKRSVFFKALNSGLERKVRISDLKFEKLSKAVLNSSQLHHWELELETRGVDVNIYYATAIKGMSANCHCQLQFMSKGNVEREGEVVRILKGLETLDGHKCLSFSYYVADHWVETTDQIRVILTFSSPIQLIPPPMNDVYGNDSTLPSFEILFLSDHFSDISVSSKDEKWPAHKIILAHCSEVFKRMVQTEMKETQEGNIKLDEFDPNAVKEMLRFAYTGKLEATADMSMDIFKLSHTYEIKGLKRRVVPLIVNSITLETAPDMYSFGELYDDPLIMTWALSIAKANKKALFANIEQWKTLVDTHPNFVYQLFIQESRIE